MKTKDLLFEFNDIAILLQYLYIDKNHCIRYKNEVASFIIRMDENLDIKSLNQNFGDLPEYNWNSEFCPNKMLGLIDWLKKQPAREFPESFDNRWKEIKDITLTTLALNRK